MARKSPGLVGLQKGRVFMCANLFAQMKRAKFSFEFAFVLIAAMCLVSTGCSGKGEKVEASELPLAARLDQLNGEVGIGRLNNTPGSNQEISNTDWQTASVNTPVSVGTRVYVKEKSHAG